MTGTIAIIDYGSGNLRSAAKACERVVADCNLPFTVVVTDEAKIIANAARIVLPGQGAFGDCMSGLQQRGNALEGLQEAVMTHKAPFFGICVGMQLLATQGLEHGVHQGLGWIAGEVVKMTPQDPALKIPHMGWNTLSMLHQGHAALQHITQDDHFYFVHSFMMESLDKDHILAVSDYGGSVTAIVGRDHILGVQFHAEKSQDAGLRLIRGFLEWQP
jgi:glutamine amidotransferase